MSRLPGSRPGNYRELPVDAPIGMFDSGVGGLTVARSVLDQLPAERLVYIGDTLHGPYGPLPVAQVRRHALALGDELVDRGSSCWSSPATRRPRPAWWTPASATRCPLWR